MKHFWNVIGLLVIVTVFSSTIAFGRIVSQLCTLDGVSNPIEENLAAWLSNKANNDLSAKLLEMLNRWSTLSQVDYIVQDMNVQMGTQCTVKCSDGTTKYNVSSYALTGTVKIKDIYIKTFKKEDKDLTIDGKTYPMHKDFVINADLPESTCPTATPPTPR